MDKYSEPIRHKLGQDRDLLLNGLIDSFNILKIIGALTQGWGTQLELATLDGEQITILEPCFGMSQKMQRSRIS